MDAHHLISSCSCKAYWWPRCRQACDIPLTPIGCEDRGEAKHTDKWFPEYRLSVTNWVWHISQRQKIKSQMKMSVMPKKEPSLCLKGKNLTADFDIETHKTSRTKPKVSSGISLYRNAHNDSYGISHKMENFGSFLPLLQSDLPFSPALSGCVGLNASWKTGETSEYCTELLIFSHNQSKKCHARKMIRNYPTDDLNSMEPEIGTFH